jgi:hypothetical protein
MEKIMSKSNDTSNLVTLADSELDAVSGGIWFLGYRAPATPSLIEGIKGESNDGPHKDPIEIS